MRILGPSRITAGAIAVALGAFIAPVGATTALKAHQLQELKGVASGDRFGLDSAMQGNTLVVGAQGRNGSAGAVYIYLKSGSKWTLQKVLTGSDTIAGDAFGNAVALSGSTLVVGAEGHNGARGAVYVFSGSGKSWTQRQELTVPPSGSYGQFGWSVAISGTTLVAGAVNVSGAAFVFTEHAGTWTMRKELTASDEVMGDGFGANVAISSSAIFVGSPFHGAKAGAVYVFTGSGSAWSQRAELRGKDTVAGDNFGWGELGVSGNTLLASAPFHGSGAGSAYVFSGGGSSWSQRAELKGKDHAANDHFGFGESIDGNVIVVGADRHGVGGNAYVFTKSGTTWRQAAEFTGNNTSAGDAFGRWVSLTTVGSSDVAFVGAPLGNSNTGVGYLFNV